MDLMDLLDSRETAADLVFEACKANKARPASWASKVRLDLTESLDRPERKEIRDLPEMRESGELADSRVLLVLPDSLAGSGRLANRESAERQGNAATLGLVGRKANRDHAETRVSPASRV